MNKLKMQSKNLVDENIEKISSLFPNCVSEGLDESGKLIKVVDFDLLKQELSKDIVEGNDERYVLNWAGKKASMLAANAPIAKTLRPVFEESVGKNGDSGKFDSENLYIEGDNLDVLKLLRETYLGKVKMIYIDPPYNTGKDFVYKDDFSMSAEEYFEKSNQIDDQGNRLFTNNDSNGKFHSDWLSMMYMRLKLARDLLTEDGVIFMSIDDNEVHNLRKICDEIFGENNFVAILAIENNPKGRKNGKFFSINYEFCIVYAKNYNISEKFNEIVTKKNLLEDKFGKYTHGKRVLVGKSTNNTLKNIDSDKNYTVYYNVQKNDLVIQVNKFNEFDDVLINLGYNVYQSSDGVNLLENTYTADKIIELFKSNSLIFKENSIYEKDRNVFSQQKTLISSTKEFDLKTESADFKIDNFELKAIFNNPKNNNFIKMLAMLIPSNDHIVLDFFSGSSTTAHAVMQLNAEDGGNRKHIMVQLPEKTDEKSEAFKAGYKTIPEIAKERILRAGKKILEDNKNSKEPKDLSNLDIGFRVLKLDDSNMKDVDYSPSELKQETIFDIAENIKEDRTEEDLLFQVMLDMGVLLSSEIKTLNIENKKVFNVNNGNLVCCFDKNLSESVVTQIAQMKPLYAVFRDSSISSDSMSVNFDQIFETYSPTTKRKVI